MTDTDTDTDDTATPTELPNPESCEPGEVTPDVWQAWSSEDQEVFNARQAQRHEREAQENLRELSEEEQAARDALLTAAGERAATETVELSDDVEIEVRPEISGRDEEKLARIDEHDSVADALDDILDVLCGPPGTEPGDAEYTGVIVSPVEYAKREAWRDVYRVHGSAFLMEATADLTAPARERMEALGNTHGATADRRS